MLEQSERCESLAEVTAAVLQDGCGVHGSDHRLDRAYRSYDWVAWFLASINACEDDGK